MAVRSISQHVTHTAELDHSTVKNREEKKALLKLGSTVLLLLPNQNPGKLNKKNLN